MQTLEAAFRTVTPMFLSGADQSRAELRVPSIKGALRFWWRTRAYRSYAGDLAIIKRKESDLFGSTDMGQAKVSMHLTGKNIQPNVPAKQNKWKLNEWQAYVGYGLIESVPSQTGKTSREFIPKDHTFALQLILNKGLTDIDRKSISDALNVFGLLGGLGGRSRKGWGSITLTRLTGSDLHWEEPVDVVSLKRILAELNVNVASASSQPVFTAFSTETQIVVGPVKDKAEEAHRYLAEKYKNAVKSTQPKSDREQFGLPRGQNQNRRAGPLFLHIHGFPNGTAAPVAAFLPAQFLSDQPNLPGNGDDIKSFLVGIREAAK